MEKFEGAFDPSAMWFARLEEGRRICEVAQKEIHRYIGEEALSNVIMVDFTPREEETSA